MRTETDDEQQLGEGAPLGLTVFRVLNRDSGTFISRVLDCLDSNLHESVRLVRSRSRSGAVILCLVE